MTGLNTGMGGPEVLKQKPVVHGNIQELLTQSTRDVVWRNDSCSQQVLNFFETSSAKKTETIADIRAAMLRTKINDSEWENIEDTKITNMSEQEIRLSIEKFARPLRNARQLALDTLFRHFPNLTLTWHQLRDSLCEYGDENDLMNIIETRANMKRYLSTEHHLSGVDLEVWTPDYRVLFDYDNLPGGDLKDRIAREVELVTVRHQPFSKDLLRELVGLYSHAPQKIKTICKNFGITFTLKEAQDSWLIEKNDITNITKTAYSDIWDTLDATQKWELEYLLLTDDTFTQTLEQIEQMPRDIDSFLGNKYIKNLLAGKLHRSIAETLDGVKEDTDTITTSLTEFLEKTGWKNNGIQQKIQSIRDFHAGKVLVLKKASGQQVFLKIEKVDVDLPIADGLRGVELSTLNSADGKWLWVPKWTSHISYETLEKWLLSTDIVQGQIMNHGDLITEVDAWTFTDEGGNPIANNIAEEDTQTLEYLQNQLNTIDDAGKNIPIEVGTVFTAIAKTAKGAEVSQSFTIKKISPPNITISNGRDIETATFAEFIEIARGSKFSRLALLRNDPDFLAALAPYGVAVGTKLSNHKLVTEVEEDDGHGHKHKTESNYEFFQSEDWQTHIRITGIDTDHVMIWEYEWEEDDKKDKKGKKKVKKYTGSTLTRAEFLAYLKAHKLKATTDNLLDPDATSGYKPHDAHMHGSFFGSFLKGISVNDMVKGFGNIMHGIEHYFEKNSKLNASRFALKMGRTFGLPIDIMAQLQADEVASMKEIIEKIQDKLGNLNGPVWRGKALHIAQLTSSSPEEIGASMLFMVKWYGQLYAEDISYAQGGEHFVNGFLYSLGWTSPAEITAMKKDARAKFKADLWSWKDGSTVTEEEIIWGLLKIIDGRSSKSKWDDGYDPRYANAGAVVKAMGWPGGWEKSWRTEGIENAYQKGIRQWGAVVNAEGRVNKWLSAFNTFELNTVIGFMEKAAWKTPHPSIQSLPIIWNLGWYSRYASTEMLQKVKQYGDSQGHTFHAYSFTRNAEDNTTYTNAFITALTDIDQTAGGKAKWYIETLQKGPQEKWDAKKSYEDAISELNKIWLKYWDSGLHDHLQGKDTWLMKKVNEGNPDMKKYADRLSEIHQMNSKESPPPQDNDWIVQQGYVGSPLFENAEKPVNKKNVLSLNRSLIKIPMDGYDLSTTRKIEIWPGIVGAFQGLKNESDEELKEAQYIQYRNDIIQHFRNKMRVSTSRWSDGAVEEIQRKTYYPDLLKMGIDPKDFFANTPIGLYAQRDYSRWLTWWASTQATIANVKGMIDSDLGWPTHPRRPRP
jgi:hypothetical protein